jgi:YggT family protein
MVLLYRAIRTLINLIEILILVRIVLSFLNIRGGGSIIKFAYELTEPILGPARQLISKIGINTGMFDFSPIVAILILRAIDSIAYRLLI